MTWSLIVITCLLLRDIRIKKPRNTSIASGIIARYNCPSIEYASSEDPVSLRAVVSVAVFNQYLGNQRNILYELQHKDF